MAAHLTASKVVLWSVPPALYYISIFALANGTTLDRDAACRIGNDIWNTESFTDKLTWPLTKDSSALSGTLTLRITGRGY